MSPTTVSRFELESSLRALGWGDGAPRLVHCSLSAFGHVIGGEQTMLEAMLSAAAGAAIVMPTQSWQLCDPAFLGWAERGTALHERASALRPAYSPELTPSRGMGRVAELLRTAPGAVRSPHPHRSFSGIGRGVVGLLSVHRRESPVGEGSPLSALYAADARITLLGASAASCTALHLAEARALGELSDLVENSAVIVPGRVEHWFEQRVSSDDFPDLVDHYRASGGEWRESQVGDARVVDVPMRALVDHAVAVLPRVRGRLPAIR